ncbi:MAG TPA: hypothetical protein VGN86_02775 [Pyrinomonadaceae bacterium]|nr:hypothetical protein [Pyrinomonadaceae bacterium]
MTINTSTTPPGGWLAFELGVLRRLKFASVALPFTGEPDLSLRLKRWNVRIAANDPMLWSFTKASALVENGLERLEDYDLDLLLDDAYVPRDRHDNQSILKWFNETDAWWFNNVRFNAERIGSAYKRALALTIGMMVGDYVLSFDEQTRYLREPLALSKVFRQIAGTLPPLFDNALRNRATNQDVRAFVAERQNTDLLYLRLPKPIVKSEVQRASLPGWREEWLQGGDDFWEEFNQTSANLLGAPVQSKQQYLGFTEDLLQRAAHLPSWAIMHVENGFISSEDVADTVSRVRKIDSIYTKDFSDLLGVKASIITA